MLRGPAAALPLPYSSSAVSGMLAPLLTLAIGSNTRPRCRASVARFLLCTCVYVCGVCLVDVWLVPCTQVASVKISRTHAVSVQARLFQTLHTSKLMQQERAADGRMSKELHGGLACRLDAPCTQHYCCNIALQRPGQVGAGAACKSAMHDGGLWLWLWQSPYLSTRICARAHLRRRRAAL